MMPPPPKPHLTAKTYDARHERQDYANGRYDAPMMWMWRLLGFVVILVLLAGGADDLLAWVMAALIAFLFVAGFAWLCVRWVMGPARTWGERWPR